MISYFRKRRTDKVIEEAFEEGMWCRLGGDKTDFPVLSDSGYRGFNGVRLIAWRAGQEAAEIVLTRKEQDLGSYVDGRPRRRLVGFLLAAPGIPGKVYVECYGEMKLA